MAAFREVKRHLDGREEIFVCEPLRIGPAAAAVRFVLPQAMGGYPAGTTTTGYFWAGRTYTLYAFLSPGGEPLGRRFDVADEVRISSDRVEYLDLLLDVVVDPSGTATVEDQDEVDEATASGLLTGHRRDVIERTRDLLLRDHERIAHEADEWLGGG